MSQRDLEFKILAGIVPTHTLRMERAHLRLISEDNFNEPNFKILWSHLNAYYDDHMAVMPEWVLKEHLDRANLSEAKKLAIVEIYKFLASNVVSDHEFDESIRLLKDAEITRKTDESIVTAREILNGQYYDENGERVLKGQEEARSYLSEALQQLETVDGDFAPEGDVTDDLEKIWSQYLQKESNPEEHAGILYGIEELDECTGGVRAGELVLLAGFTGSGKASPLWEKVLTPTGWTTIGELEVGSTIIDPTTGGNQTVVGVHDRGVMDTYRVTTRNGDSVLVAGDHLWQVQTSQQRNGKVMSSNSVMTTDEIREGLSNGRRYYVPVTKPVEFEVSTELPFGAYTVGALLGDGSLTQRVEITSHDTDSPEVVSLVSAGLGMGHRVVHDLGHTYRYRFPSGNLDMYNLFKELGMTCTSINKFIPEMYLRASLEDRLELLRGLMDTDGTVAAGTPEFSTSSKRLAEDVRELVKSLGGIVGSLRSKIPTYRNSTGDVVPGKRAYSFTVKLPNGIIPFHLKRKASLVKSENRLTKHGFDQPIKSIERVGSEEVRCISVSGPSHLYITSDYLVTHNSQMLTNLAWNSMRNGHNVIMFTTETTREEMEIRLLARHSRLSKFKLPGGLDSHQIMSGTLNEAHRTVFREVLDDFKAGQPGNLIMVQMPANGYVDYVHAKANQYNRNTPIDLVLIDSINLLRSSRRYDSKREMLEDLLQGFKRFASSFDNGRGVAVVSPWQMSRPAWKEASEAGGIYTLASLADTSEAEKSQPLDAKVLTPGGFINMGDTEVGMTIIGSDGGTQTIDAVTENGMRDILEVVLNDGSFTRCSPNHLWTVMGDGGVPVTMTAQEIMDSGKSFQIPVMDNQPEFHTENNIVGGVFNPTIMGYFLQAHRVIEGSVTLSTGDLSRVTKGFPVVPDYSLVETIDGSVVYSLSYYRPGFKDYEYIDTLDEANLFCGDSSRFRIPRCYLEGSHHVREALVRTFMKNPKANLHSSKVPFKELADLPYDHPGYGAELKYLVWSLGWSTQAESRKIVRVVNTGNVEPVRCITVSNPDGLYVTDDFIVTHNSSSQIITIFKEDTPSSSQLNIQVLKNRSGPEMPKVSYPYDYRNSFIGVSGDSSSTPKANNSAASVKQDIGNIIGL